MMGQEQLILDKLERLTREVTELKNAVNGNGNGGPPDPVTTTAPTESLKALTLSLDGQQELQEQLALSGANLAKWLRQLDQLMELKEDLAPLGRRMMDEVIQTLDQATQGFDPQAFRELIRQFVLNLSALAEAIRMVGGLMELKADSADILQQAFDDLTLRLETLKQKGFFDSMNQVLRMLELVGQKMLELDTSKVEPIKGFRGLYRTLQQPDFQQGMGIIVELVSALAVLKEEKPV